MTHVVFMGSPDFAVPALRALASHYDVVGVVTQPDRESGRGRALKSPSIKTLAVELGLDVFQPEKLRAPEAMDQLRLWNPELIVVTAFGQILKSDVLALPPHGCINVHASLLPRWRGAAPIQAAILAGDSQIGVTIMKMDKGVDTGDLIDQCTLKIEEGDTAASLSDSLSYLGADLLIETLPRYLSGELKPQVQEEDRATYAPMLKKEDGLLDFNRPVEELIRRVHAFNPWPGTYFEWGGGLLKVHLAHAEMGNASEGQRLVYQGQPAVGARGGLLILDQVQPAAKKSMSGKAFLSGTRNWSDETPIP
jgi:methionyl-tRNA formyltransferase